MKRDYDITESLDIGNANNPPNPITNFSKLYIRNGIICTLDVNGIEKRFSPSSILVGDKVIVSNGNSITESIVTSTELNYLSGANSDIQTQINNKQPLDNTLNALSNYNTNGIVTQTAPDAFEGRTIEAGSTKIGIINGNGVNGNPIIDVNQNNLILAESQITNLVTDLAAKIPRVEVISKRLDITITSTVITAVDVTGLFFPIPANDNWIFEFYLQIGCSGNGGVKFTLTVPSGATFNSQIFGTGGSATALTSSVLKTNATLTTQRYNSFNGNLGFVRVSGVISNSVNAGNVQLQFASNTNGQTSSIFLNSGLTSRKI